MPGGAPAYGEFSGAKEPPKMILGCSTAEVSGSVTEIPIPFDSATGDGLSFDCQTW
jgi:hypothetical protein